LPRKLQIADQLIESSQLYEAKGLKKLTGQEAFPLNKIESDGCAAGCNTWSPVVVELRLCSLELLTLPICQLYNIA
jgi:hypothetical protein